MNLRKDHYRIISALKYKLKDKLYVLSGQGIELNPSPRRPVRKICHRTQGPASLGLPSTSMCLSVRYRLFSCTPYVGEASISPSSTFKNTPWRTWSSVDRGRGSVRGHFVAALAGFPKQRKPKAQLYAVDHSARASMKSAASCVN